MKIKITGNCRRYCIQTDLHYYVFNDYNSCHRKSEALSKLGIDNVMVFEF